MWAPVCSERECDAPPAQQNGQRSATGCLVPFLYHKTCQFECDAGYTLPEGATSLITCDVKTAAGGGVMQWDDQPTSCTGTGGTGGVGPPADTLHRYRGHGRDGTTSRHPAQVQGTREGWDGLHRYRGWGTRMVD